MSVRPLRSMLKAAFLKVDAALLARLPASMQVGLKRALLGAARLVLRGAVPADVPRELLYRPAPVAAPDMKPTPDVAAKMLRLAVHIEPSLEPSRFFGDRVESYTVPWIRAASGAAYRRLARQCPRDVDAVLLVPWLKPGGADLGTIHHANYLTRELGCKVLVIATEPAASPWADRLPEGAKLLEAGRELAQLHFAKGDDALVLARLLLQLAPKSTHIIGSRVAWDAVSRFGLALNQCTTIYASLFCDEVDTDGVPDGYAVRYLAGCAPHLRRVFSDNRFYPREWSRRMGVDPAIFRLVRFPAPDVAPRRPEAAAAPVRMLWAGRLDRQKRVDVLEHLVARTREFRWDIHGRSVVPGHASDIRNITRAENAVLHGEYRRFSEIVTPEHSCFIYTSQWDGMPNVILEAAAAGLPIVAPDVGGISEFLPAGCLIGAVDDIEGYVARIRTLVSSDVERNRQLDAQYAALAERTWASFCSDLAAEDGYGAK